MLTLTQAHEGHSNMLLHPAEPHLPMQAGVSVLVWMKTGRMVHVNKKPEYRFLHGTVTGDVTGSNQ